MSYIHADGVEYSDDKKTLVRCPKEATEITILDGVTSIGEDAFRGCGLKEIRIPKGTRNKFPELKKYENLLVEYKKE